MPSPPSPLLTLSLRTTQALLSLVIFALSVALIHGRRFGSIPLVLLYSALSGGCSLLGAVLGIAAQWREWEVLRGKFGVLADGMIAGNGVVAGVYMAVKLKGVRCQHVDWHGDRDLYYCDNKDVCKMLSSSIICGGLKKVEDYYVCGYLDANDGVRARLFGRCVMSQADAVLLFLTAGVVGLVTLLGYLRLKRE
ncbi:hypothetical protein E8E13_005211 [Curvularia kusanoi]|uniref:Uncharacterized protein n=1 Tax=Curvularia kusanoi TaxID=90978 RepID=A0A9P4TCV6_CURKU|nr:hypothetical protein E8E13_005211 [Curvularia kusanoi]